MAATHDGRRPWWPATLAALAIVGALGLVLRPPPAHSTGAAPPEVLPRWSAATLIPALEHMPAADGVVACVVNGAYPGSVVVLERSLSTGRTRLGGMVPVRHAAAAARATPGPT